MRVEIFNVDHGSCVLATTPEGQTILMDCGSSSGTLLSSWNPGQMLSARGIRFLGELVVSHADEDHVSGLQSIVDARIGINWIETNPTLTPQIIRSLKPETPGPAVTLFLLRLGAQQLAQSRASTSLGEAPSKPTYTIGKHEFSCFYSPTGAVRDANNLSLVTFLFSGGLKMVFPGDLEEAGWKTLLANQEFCSTLQQVNVFVASHHGRRNGFCADVFGYCKPELIVFSDSSIAHDTQQTAGLYRQYASGAMFGDNVRRHVLTTRNNGNITFTATAQWYEANIARA